MSISRGPRLRGRTVPWRASLSFPRTEGLAARMTHPVDDEHSIHRPEGGEEVPSTPPQAAPAEYQGDMRASIIAKLTYAIGKDPTVAKDHDWLLATILAVRDRAIDRWMASTRDTYRAERTRVYYLSLEFLIGRLLRDAMSNLALVEDVQGDPQDLGVDLDAIVELEPDAALGNGGLGRLAACFMESMATVDIPAYGYGIRYDHGLFRQKIIDGWQVELPEDWLSSGNPWEFARPECAYEIGFGGSVQEVTGDDGVVRHVWNRGEVVMATAYDTPIVGWRG